MTSRSVRFGLAAGLLGSVALAVAPWLPSERIENPLQIWEAVPFFPKKIYLPFVMAGGVAGFSFLVSTWRRTRAIGAAGLAVCGLGVWFSTIDMAVPDDMSGYVYASSAPILLAAGILLIAPRPLERIAEGAHRVVIQRTRSAFRESKRTRGGLVIVAVLVLLLVVDWVQRNRDLDHLLDAVEVSESAMEDALASLGEADDAKVEAACLGAYANKNDCFHALGPTREAANDSAIQIRTTQDAVEHSAVLPWHRSIEEARAAYVDHSKAWVAYWDAIAGGRAVTHDSEISATFAIAHNRFIDATPVGAIFHASDRIAELFDD